MVPVNPIMPAGGQHIDLTTIDHQPHPTHVQRQDTERHDSISETALKQAVELSKLRPSETDDVIVARAVAFRAFLKGSV